MDGYGYGGYDDAIKEAIEQSTNNKVYFMRVNEWNSEEYPLEDYDDHYINYDGVDKEVAVYDEDRNFKHGQTLIVFQNRTNSFGRQDVILLREVGTMKANGEPFKESLRKYLPRNVFRTNQNLWDEEEQVKAIKQKYFDNRERSALFVDVVYGEKVPVLKIKRIEETPEDWECGICREGKDELPIVQLRCGGNHIFHSVCVKAWGKTKVERDEETTCPMCVRVVSSTSSQEPASQQTPIGMDIT
jgi:hypothetical protein